MKSKLVITALILITSVAADQITKLWAEAVLASPQFPDHAVTLTVTDSHDGKTLEDFVNDELTWTDEEDKGRIMGSESPGFVVRADRRLRPDTVLTSGDELDFHLKTATVIDGFWKHHYARNTGAAFSLGSDGGRWFFVGASILAIFGIGYFIYTVSLEQRRLIVALALVLGGAIGNLIDRVAYGYVIDFVSWDLGFYVWPTFNIADAVICVGIGLLAIEIIFGEEPEKASAKAKEDADSDAIDASGAS